MDTAIQHHLLAELRVGNDTVELAGNFGRVVGIGIEGSIATSLRHGRDIGCDNRSVATHRLENGNAEPLEEGHVGRSDGAGIERGEIGEIGILDDMNPRREVKRTGGRLKLGLVGTVGTANDEQMDIVGKRRKGFDNGYLILTFLDGAYRNDVLFWKIVLLADIILVVVGDRIPKLGVARLVDDTDFGLGDMDKLHQVLLGLLADGNNDIGEMAGMADFDAVHQAVERGIELREAPNDEVVDGYHLLDGAGNAVRELVAEPVEDVDLVVLEMDSDAETTPDVGEKAVDAGRLTGRDIGKTREIAPVLARHHRGIEKSTCILMLMSQTTYYHAAIVAQSCIVLKGALSVETNNHYKYCLNLQKYKKKTYLCKFNEEKIWRQRFQQLSSLKMRNVT